MWRLKERVITTNDPTLTRLLCSRLRQLLIALTAFVLCGVQLECHSSSAQAKTTYPERLPSKLERFKIEVERVTGHTVKVYRDGKPNPAPAGITYCSGEELKMRVGDPGDVEIHIRVGDPADVEEGILAHEFGHGILCARLAEIKSVKFVPPYLNPPDWAKEAAEMISHCLIEKLADQEAIKRGVDLSARNRQRRSVQSHQEITEAQRRVAAEDPLYARYRAVSTFCFVLVDPGLYKANEALITSSPTIRETFDALQMNVKIRSCNTTATCLEGAKQIRKIAGFDGVFTFRDPQTGQQE